MDIALISTGNPCAVCCVVPTSPQWTVVSEEGIQNSVIIIIRVQKILQVIALKLIITLILLFKIESRLL